MEWSDTGVILGTRRHGEHGVILEVMTAEHGRHLGLVRGGRSRRMQPVLQTGNSLALTWRARLEDQLGAFQVELETSRAATVMASACALYTLQTVAAHLRHLPERQAYRPVHSALTVLMNHAGDPETADVDILAPLLVRLELALLDALGFGLDLSACAATGANDALAYVSPKSGRAVSMSAGEAWKDKLLSLPPFLTDRRAAPFSILPEDVRNGFRLTGHFLARDVYGAQGIALPDTRQRLEALIQG